MNISMRRLGRHSFPSSVPRTPGKPPGRAGRLLWPLLLATPLVFSQTLPGTWLFFGGGLDNNHSASFEQNITTRNVGTLGVKWVYQTTLDTGTSNGSPLTNGDITVPPAVLGGVLYFPDWAGNLRAVNATNGTTVWKKSFAGDYARPGKFMLFSRNTPAVTVDRLIVGSEKHLLLPVCPQDHAYVVLQAIGLAIDCHLEQSRVQEAFAVGRLC